MGLLHKERDQADVARAYELQREDSIARRITDLYTRAVESLGSEKAPVRLGGLYALERLAQDHVEQRQTIVNVLCAYLRMPYSLPGNPPADGTDDTLVTEHRERTQEREVRLAAQRILAHHLRKGGVFGDPVETFWAAVDIDLTGATLINTDFSRCVMRDVSFFNATFFGTAIFDSANFAGESQFNGAKFAGPGAFFDNVTFVDKTLFSGAVFTGDVRFSGAKFMGDAWFTSAKFAGNAQFAGARFTGKALFGGIVVPVRRFMRYDTETPWTCFDGARFDKGAPSEVQPFEPLQGAPPQVFVDRPD